MATQSMKRIHTVSIKREQDESPDTSWLGEYSDTATSEYSIDREHAQDCSSQEHNHRETVDRLERAIDYLNRSGEELVGEAFDEALTVLGDAQDEAQQCDCCGGDMGRHEYRYFNPSFNYVDAKGHALPENTPEEVRKYVRQDYERMESAQRGDWCMLYVVAKADVVINGVVQHITSGGIGGVESDAGEYFKELEQDELGNLRDQLHALGFSKRAISAAFREVQRAS